MRVLAVLLDQLAIFADIVGQERQAETDADAHRLRPRWYRRQRNKHGDAKQRSSASEEVAQHSPHLMR